MGKFLGFYLAVIYCDINDKKNTEPPQQRNTKFFLHTSQKYPYFIKI